jgi:hypothetical protein
MGTVSLVRVLVTSISALAVLIAGLAGATAARAGFVPALGSPFSYAAPTSSLAVLDGDRNGTVDVVAGGLTLRRGAGTGFLGNPVTVGLTGPVTDVAAGDLNGDGLVDYAALVPGAAPGDPVALVRFLAFPGNGFSEDTIDADVGDATALAVAELDGDSLPDIVYVRDAADPNVTVVHGDLLDSDELPSGIASAGADGPSDVALGDLTGDGRPEIVVARGGAANVSVLRNEGGGSFADGELEPTGGSGPSRRIALTHVDGDGRLDLLAIEPPTALRPLLGDGSGGFQPLAAIPSGLAGGAVRSVAAGDVNGDGLTDVVSGGDGSFAALLGDGRGGVRHSPGEDVYPSRSPLPGDAVDDIVVADMNRDGQPDVVTANRGGSVSVMLNDATGLLAASPAGVGFGRLLPATGLRTRRVMLRAERGQLRITRLERQGSRNFSVRDVSCVGRTLTLGQACAVDVTFNVPRRARRYEGLLSVDANAAAVVVPLGAEPRGPVVRRARLKRKRVTAGTRLDLRYGLSEGALTRVLTERARPGRRVGGKCVATQRGNLRRPRCTLWQVVARATRRDLAGRNRIRVATREQPTGRGRKRRRGDVYPAGAYRLSVSALDRFRNRSDERRLRFKLTRPRAAPDGVALRR